MKSGMLAAETAFDALRAGDTSSHAVVATTSGGSNASWIREELYPVRNVHQAFGHGLVAGLAFSAWTADYRGALAGAGQRTAWPHADAVPRTSTTAIARSRSSASNAVRPDRVLTFDKVTSVHYSGTRHDEDQPAHLLVQTDVCYSRCGEEFGHPCQRSVPAHVYEMVEEGGRKRLQINASNCVHCKTCDIMDPYQVITWVPPEGGGGPQYDGL